MNLIKLQKYIGYIALAATTAMGLYLIFIYVTSNSINI